MNNTFLKTFFPTMILALILLVGIEWFINKSVQSEHVFGWLFVAAFIGAMLGITRQNANDH